MAQLRRLEPGSSILLIAIAGILLPYCVLFTATPVGQAHGSVRRLQLIYVLLSGLIALACGLSVLRVHGWVALFPLVGFIQVLPLPIAFVGLVSPHRAWLAEQLVPILPPAKWVPLSVSPPATLYYTGILGATVIVCLAVYHLLGTLPSRWAAVLPLILIGSTEALLGLVQVFQQPSGIATGTYDNRNHYACLLATILPLAVVYALRAPVLRTALAGGVAGLFLTAIALSLSRMGLASAVLPGVAVVLVAMWPKRTPRQRIAFAAALLLLAVALLAALPGRFILRLAHADTEGRLAVWRETLPLIAAYPVFGCGLGTFESAFGEFKRSAPMVTQDYAHNDYLQYAAESGALGLALFLIPLIAIWRRLVRYCRRVDGEKRHLALGCLAAIGAVAIHSLVDFNLYDPPNMLTFGWVLAISASLTSEAAD
jgi:O-antigen ligase